MFLVSIMLKKLRFKIPTKKICITLQNNVEFKNFTSMFFFSNKWLKLKILLTLATAINCWLVWFQASINGLFSSFTRWNIFTVISLTDSSNSLSKLPIYFAKYPYKLDLFSSLIFSRSNPPFIIKLMFYLRCD